MQTELETCDKRFWGFPHKEGAGKEGKIVKMENTSFFKHNV